MSDLDDRPKLHLLERETNAEPAEDEKHMQSAHGHGVSVPLLLT